MDFEKLLALYDYSFPEMAIAQKPASPRDSARLLVYNRKTGKIAFDIFRDLGCYLPKGAVLVFNETKVVPARIWARKATGGKIQLLYLGTEKGLLKFIVDRKIHSGEKIFFGEKETLILVRQEENVHFFKPSFLVGRVMEILERFGETPIPPYIKHSPLKESELKQKYQTVFAKIKGSVAAPTASLHFTKRLMSKLRKSGFDLKFITLHVNLGTFAKLTPEQVEESRLHKEYYEIKPAVADFLNKAKSAGRPIIAVGTTVVRTLESASGQQGKLSELIGETNLFIKEGYRFKYIDGLITNFHVPKSSLLILVAAFVGREKILGLYKKAITKGFSLFSFGDGMLIW
ncbi:MAG: tRNA preQ1(34) S-adenosylmethionine ribosyltransferase-isomerase QueA [Patescibacteria group bacterium]|nr:tRNA preQ1(34) S-adenosylmethionine ribosyltransferase-isomerase QueA [Patescibacteria group bacterium]MCL5261839.1 tRNA preQ1(34) S-adenosylmethionine ribosyltransferase-isomerase QueA [Patescibacteria group bacterium]